jgi:hypothetical protein
MELGIRVSFVKVPEFRGFNTPNPQYATAHLSIPHFSVTIALLYLGTSHGFGDFGDHCNHLTVRKLLGDWGIVNVIVMWDK